MTVNFSYPGHRSRSRVAVPGELSPQLMTGFDASYGLYTSPALYETYPSLSRAAVGATVRLTVVDVATGRKVNRVFVKHSPTMIDADYFGIGWTHLLFDVTGRIVSADASGTTEQTRTSRTDFRDLHASSQKYAADDRAGKGIGPASPDVVARGTIGGRARSRHLWKSPHARSQDTGRRRTIRQRLAHGGQCGNGALPRQQCEHRRYDGAGGELQPLDFAQKRRKCRSDHQRAARPVGDRLRQVPRSVSHSDESRRCLALRRRISRSAF